LWSIRKKTFETSRKIDNVHAVILQKATQIMRCLVVVSFVCSWLAISNHCAVAAIVAQKAETTPSECPFHSKPEKKRTPPGVQECCKTLRAVVANAAKNWARDDANFSIVDLSVALPIVLADSHNAAPLLLDTGPPGKTSFGQLIGSMRAHAPPSRV
jgi:hypothetical protein